MKSTIFVIGILGASVSLFAVWTLWRQRKRKAKKHGQYHIEGKSIHVVDSAEEWETIYKSLMQHLTGHKVLGLDCEWVQKRKVALLQLATTQGLCVLVRLFKLPPVIPHTLKTLLADKSILKVGVAVMDDGKKLHQDYGLKVMGCVDLRHMLRRVRANFNCPSRGLQGLTEGVLKVTISKDYNVRCGNWEAEVYSQKQQIDYAATDAAVAVDIFLQFVSAKMEMSQSSKNASSGIISDSDELLPGQSNECDSLLVSQEYLQKEAVDEENDRHVCSLSRKVDIPSDLTMPQEIQSISVSTHSEFWKTARSMCQGIVDAGYVHSAKYGGLPSFYTKTAKNKKEATEAYSTRRRPLWDNCRLEAPDGNVLCTCDVRKAQWYLDKSLGEQVCEDPLTVRLLFEPANRPQTERNYYLQEKENICVVCGWDRDYVRKFVIPFEYRKYFPSALKDHSSHDVLLLCTTCHRRSCDFDSFLRLQLAQECDAPMESGATAKTVMDHDLQKVRSAGRALKLNRDSIPTHRVKELEKVLIDFFGIQTLTEELIQEASDIDARQTAEDYVPHGKLVVRYMAKNGGLLAFQARWRQHFLDSMNPEFLPAFWSVDFVPEGWTQHIAHQQIQV